VRAVQGERDLKVHVVGRVKAVRKSRADGDSTKDLCLDRVLGPSVAEAANVIEEVIQPDGQPFAEGSQSGAEAVHPRKRDRPFGGMVDVLDPAGEGELSNRRGSQP